MTPFLERIRETVDPLVDRLRESPRAMLATLVAAIVLGLLVGRWTSPRPVREIGPVADAAAVPAPKATDFESLVAADSPFETSRQGEQKRLVALQNTLGAAITEFDGVGKASVFIAPRSPTAGLGASASSRTASVHLTMEPGRRLDDGQVEAIAKLVAGAETGLRPESVAIVDGSGPRASSPVASDAAAVERMVDARLASLLPEGTRPEVAVSVRPADDGPASLDVAVAIPHAYFVAAHALAGDDPGELDAFRASEAERLADATRRSLEASLDPASMRIASCRVDWTFVSPGPLPAEAFPWTRTAILASLGLVASAAILVPLVRARRRPPSAAIEPRTVLEPKLADVELEEVLRRDPTRAAEAIERWVRGGAA